MSIKKAILCLFFGVTSMTCGVIQAHDSYHFLDKEELKFIYSLDQIYMSQPRQFDYLFLAGFDMKYLEWKSLFLDEVESDYYSGECIEVNDDDNDEELKDIQHIGRVFLFGRYTEQLAKQIPCDGHR